MPTPEVWGPPTWTLFHVMAEKINEKAYPLLCDKMLQMIKLICKNLPCPYCATDATIFLNKISLGDLKTKRQFKDMLYLFHNYVNNKKKKRLFNYANINYYNIYNIVTVSNNFIKVYHTKGNMQQLSESFQRQLVLNTFKRWMKENIKYFR
jgi:hypothetical protein